MTIEAESSPFANGNALTLGEAEDLVILEAIGPSGGSPAEITARLGLAPELTEAVMEAGRSLGMRGMVTLEYAPALYGDDEGSWEMADILEFLRPVTGLRRSEAGEAHLRAARRVLRVSG